MRSGRGSNTLSRILLIDRDPACARAIATDLTDYFGDLRCVTNVACGLEARASLRAEQYDILLIDLSSISDVAEASEAAITKLARLAGDALIIATSSGMSVSCAVEAMRGGAHDYIAKPLSGAGLTTRLEELARRHGKSRALTSEPATTSVPTDFEGFVGQSSQIQFVFEQISRIATSSAPVFITGESGTGKELCAQALHAKGARSSGPFIAINCGAIPHDLMESELFGVVRGAYTGAMEDRKGAAELANGGTLFLDEIGEMDLGLQTKLLRFLQTGCISRIGDGLERPVDVRVVCATNRNPMDLIAEKKFREDLFYRLHVLPIHLPPLRQRPADILPLAQHFLRQAAREECKHFRKLSAETADLFVSREWPGNVRQLQNLIRRIVVMFDGSEVSANMANSADIETFATLRPKAQARTAPNAKQTILPMWQQEQRIIEEALTRYDGNIAQAAAALEISPSTIYRKKQVWEEKQEIMAGAA